MNGCTELSHMISLPYIFDLYQFLHWQENVGGTTYFYNAEDFTPQREGIVSFSLLYSAVPL